MTQLFFHPFQQPGKLKLTDEKVQFKNSKSGKTEVIPQSEIDLAGWQRFAGTWGIRLFTKDGSLHRFAGFKEAVRTIFVTCLVTS